MIKENDEVKDEDVNAAIRGYDWYNVFAWASGETRGTSDGGALPDWAIAAGMIGSAEPFSRLDVEDIYAAVNGQNEESDWMAFGKLKDGRFFFISAGCDYTGWDCQSSGRSYVAWSRDQIEKFIITAEERQRLGL